MHQISHEMQACIEECLRCYQTCLGMAMGHCLEHGGKHVEQQHFRLMMACAEICRTSAHFMWAVRRITSIPAASAQRFAGSVRRTANGLATCRSASTRVVVVPKAVERWRRS